MKHLITFRVYESQTTSGLTPEQEDFLNRYTEGTWSVIPTTGLVDIQGSFNFVRKGVKSFFGVEFGNVTGYFDCHGNQLQSLEGAPKKVYEGFDCSFNKLQSLAGAPREVGGYFDCSWNQLQSLKGAPKEVNGNFNCSYNQLQSLAGAPKEIYGGFACEEFQLQEGKWNMEGWLEVLENGSEEAKKLILTLPWLQPDWWNSELQRDPGKTVHLLASWWKDVPKNLKSQIKIPPGYEDEFGLFSDFDDLGLF